MKYLPAGGDFEAKFGSKNASRHRLQNASYISNFRLHHGCNYFFSKFQAISCSCKASYRKNVNFL